MVVAIHITIISKRTQRFQFKPHIDFPYPFSLHLQPTKLTWFVRWVAGKAQAVGCSLQDSVYCQLQFWTPVAGARTESKAELGGPRRELLCPQKKEGITRRDVDPGCTR